MLISGYLWGKIEYNADELLRSTNSEQNIDDAEIAIGIGNEI